MSHAESMKNHLIAQFAERPVIYAVLEALGEEMDEIAAANDDLKNKRWIDTGAGVQLDGIGEIVDRDRRISDSIQLEFFGFEGQPNTQTFGVGRFRDVWEDVMASTTLADEEYRLLLWQKVFKNSSHATTEETISSMQYVFKADHIVLHERGNAKISIGVGRRLSANDILLAQAVDLAIKAGGVGVDWYEHYDYDSYFGFLGQNNAKGFGDGAFADIF